MTRRGLFATIAAAVMGRKAVSAQERLIFGPDPFDPQPYHFCGIKVVLDKNQARNRVDFFSTKGWPKP